MNAEIINEAANLTADDTEVLAEEDSSAKTSAPSAVNSLSMI